MDGVSADRARVRGDEVVCPVGPERFVLPRPPATSWERWNFRAVPDKPWTNYTIAWTGVPRVTNDPADIERKHVFLAHDGTSWTFLTLAPSGKFQAVPKTMYDALFVPGPDMYVALDAGHVMWLPTCPESLKKRHTLKRPRTPDMSKQLVAWVQSACRQAKTFRDPFEGYGSMHDAMRHDAARRAFQQVAAVVYWHCQELFGIVPQYDTRGETDEAVAEALNTV